MSFSLKRYLNKIHQLGCKLPELKGVALYDVHVGPTGEVQGMRPNPEWSYIPIMYGFGRVRRSEDCETDGRELDFNSFAFHLEPKDQQTLSIRVDKGPNESGAHVNPDPRVEEKYGGHRLRYPDDTGLNIEHFCLLYFVILILTYRTSKTYPLDDAMNCNDVIGKFRKQVEL